MENGNTWINDHVSQWSFQSMIMQMNELIDQSINVHGSSWSWCQHDHSTLSWLLIITMAPYQMPATNSVKLHLLPKKTNKINLKINQIKIKK